MVGTAFRKYGTIHGFEYSVSGSIAPKMAGVIFKTSAAYLFCGAQDITNKGWHAGGGMGLIGVLGEGAAPYLPLFAGFTGLKLSWDGGFDIIVAPGRPDQFFSEMIVLVLPTVRCGYHF